MMMWIQVDWGEPPLRVEAHRDFVLALTSWRSFLYSAASAYPVVRVDRRRRCTRAAGATAATAAAAAGSSDGGLHPQAVMRLMEGHQSGVYTLCATGVSTITISR